jgi:hypothetical protein
LTATKRNRSSGKLGHKRGLSIRRARAIAKKYRLDQLVIFTVDRDRTEQRSRIILFGRTDAIALQASAFAKQVATAAKWPKENCEIEIASIRRLKDRVRELETALAQIVDGCPDPVALARSAGKFPNESDEENLGEWIFYPKGKLSRTYRDNGDGTANVPVDSALIYNILMPEQLAAESVERLAYWTWRKLVAMNFGNVAGELETAIKHAMRRFKGWRWNRKE